MNIENAVKAGALSKWQHPKTKEFRYYVRFEAAGILKCQYYNSGNISSATLFGDGISNSEAGRIKAVKVWMDESGELHWDSKVPYSIDREAVKIFFRDNF